MHFERKFLLKQWQDPRFWQKQEQNKLGSQNFYSECPTSQYKDLSQEQVQEFEKV